MGYLKAHFYVNGTETCITYPRVWIPGQGSGIDKNDSYRDEVSKLYLNIFGRYGEWNGGHTGVEYYVSDWIANNRTISYIKSRILANAAGIDRVAADRSKHIWGDIGTGVTEFKSYDITTKSDPDDEPLTYESETNASASFSWSNGSTSITIIRGQSASFSWNLSGGYTSASISNHGTLTSQGTVKTYYVQSIKRWFSTSPAPGDHMCSKTNPGGYSAEGELFKSFTTQAPGTFFGFDNESGVKPYAGIGYVYPRYSSGHPVGTSTIYEKIDPAGGPPNGFGTIWTRNSGGEGPYTSNGPNSGFKAPNSGYSDYSDIYFQGSATKTPFNTTSYTISASGTASYSRTITVTVLIPPIITITSTKGSSIIINQSTTIGWSVSGTASAVNWTSGDINNGNVTSSSPVSPTDTTTYCAYASGAAGNSPTVCYKVTVYQLPTASLTVPVEIDYNETTSLTPGKSFDIQYETQYANSSIQITPTFSYYDGTITQGTAITETSATSAELNGGASGTVNNTLKSGTVPIDVPWNDFGPYSISISIVATGSGGSATAVETISVNIDQTPDNLNIPASDGFFPDDAPVIAPDIDLLSQPLLIDDIDIPVEIKSNYPIQVDINETASWINVREL